jgi:putative transposase
MLASCYFHAILLILNLINIHATRPQDHRNVKRRIRITTGFKEFESAQRTLGGIEVVSVIRKNQIGDSRKTTFKTFVSLAA